MSTAFIYDHRFCDHDTGRGHPERADRLRAIVHRLKQDRLWERLEHLPFAPAAMKWIERIHQKAYIDRLRDVCGRGDPFIDTADSAICPGSYDVAVLAAGGLLAAADAVMAGNVQNAFCAVRPPGHHAEAGRSMGFCLFNNVAIAAEYLIAHHGVNRVAIVDFDVHHGNGTQHIFERRSDVLFISLHEDPGSLYPGMGYEYEKGHGPGQGYTVNLPLVPGSGDEQYRDLFQTRVVPALHEFKPEVLLISAGFDAAAEDPLANLQVSEKGFLWMTQQLVEIAQHHCRGRLISTLEGGYDLDSLARNVSGHIKTLLDA